MIDLNIYYNNMHLLIIIFLVLLGLHIIIYFNRNIKESFITSSIEKYIDVIYYINLDHRADRNDHLVNELDKINYPKEKIEKISAIYEKEKGHLGCSKSHILALQKFIESPHETCIILEDDFEFIVPPEEAIQMINNLFENKIDFDVCMLAINPIDIQSTEYLFLNKVNSGQTTSGYIVSKKFALILLENYMKGSIKLEESYMKHYKYAIDQYWKHIQPQNKFYVFNPVIGKQSASFSNILNSYVDYGF
jgi:GR25 family glycosyltransferase involved in LPS biosynthesis